VLEYVHSQHICYNELLTRPPIPIGTFEEKFVAMATNQLQCMHPNIKKYPNSVMYIKSTENKIKWRTAVRNG